MCLSDEELEKEIKAYNCLFESQLKGKAPKPVIQQSDRVLAFLQELKEWRKLGQRMNEAFKEKVNETTTEVKET
jgi:hypothetical protein